MDRSEFYHTGHLTTTTLVACAVHTAMLVLLCSSGALCICSQDSDCGYNSVCNSSTCHCEDGLTIHENLKDCVNGSCGSPDCVSCLQGSCQRCVHFIDKVTHNCLHSCTGKAEMIYTGDILGSVCTQSSGASELTDIIIGTVAGVSAGILLCIVLGLCLHFHLKRKRGQVNLQTRHLHTGPMEMGHMRKIPVFDNKAFVIHSEPPVINKETYLNEVERMKPSAQMLLDLLNQIRKRVRAMESTDARIPTYKGVIHQLCRVLVMLNKKDPGISVPADGLSLLEWARQMLQDYVETRQSLEDVDVEDEGTSSRYTAAPTLETGSTSLRSDQPISPVYAAPADSLNRRQTLTQSYAQIQPRPGHYSSAPVPYTDNQNRVNGVIRPSKSTPISSPTVPAENSGGSVESHGVRSGYLNYPYQHPVISPDPAITYTSVNNQNAIISPNPVITNNSVVSHNPSGAPSPNTKGGNPDIYAPASSFSDYAQPRFSTFSGGMARSLSSNSPSQCSSDSDDPMPDGLPFDLEDATEPVEV